ncbi:sialate O-acetylesterase [Gaetbulibacter sp. M240]|uniref:sialate O-acetylesterase n=1 Tax=Gaetbulibacter sp. M240 TaxID=3126511 RepID=UPI00374ECD74
MTKKVVLSIVFFMIVISGVFAKVKLPAIISSNMVLQRDADVALWGWADTNETLRIETSWLQNPVEVKVNSDGKWFVRVKTTLSKQAQTIRIKGNDSDILLENILFGEVWLCSGQSNMQMPVKGNSGQPIYGSQEAIINADNPNLRLFSVGRVGSVTPLQDLENYQSWEAADPKNVSNFSAVGYFFASQLQKLLDVPVGIIHTSWGSSPVESWTSKEVLSKYMTVDLSQVNEKTRMNKTPVVLFNAMINPLIPFTLKGFLWYQGEANRSEPEQYKVLLPAMVNDWRTRWENQEAPFYFAQIAPFRYGGNTFFQEVQNSAFQREAQLQCVDSISNSGIAITLDVGDQRSIHPPKKKEVADRLLGLALNKTYGFQGFDPESPSYDSMKLQNNGILLDFKNGNGLYSYDDLKGFEIAGKDHVFYPAEAKIINGRGVFVSSPKVPNPEAVRYAWNNWVEASLYGTNQLPVSSFRTDRWEEASRFNDQENQK